MAAPPPSWSADEYGGSIRIFRRVCAQGAGGTIGPAADPRWASRLATGKSVFVAGQHRPHSGVRAVDRLGGAAFTPVPFDRCGVVRGESRSMPCLTGESRPRRLLGLRAGVVFLFHLRLLPDRRALAGRYVFRSVGIRYCLAAMALSAAARDERRIFLRRATGSVHRTAVWVSADRSCRRFHVA